MHEYECKDRPEDLHVKKMKTQDSDCTFQPLSEKKCIDTIPKSAKVNTSHSPFDTFVSETRKKARRVWFYPVRIDWRAENSEGWRQLKSKVVEQADEKLQSFFFFMWNKLWIIRRTVHAKKKKKANFGVMLTLNLIIWRHGCCMHSGKVWHVQNAGKHDSRKPRS